ncbi:TPA: hypothetical protein ACSY63_06645 [Listeria monocytogenes]|nr:hypothetical protein [Listeria monocytogenes]EAE6351477.1 hypothetical protein [Listeria monocytogenes]EAE6367143.1 hypothetical protein [Listeria monocytogenes]EAE9670773.1 hypothetical protein [Listeria monocytogenes]EAF1576370.1 hypothetical protein [Listeria monocytogenes]
MTKIVRMSEKLTDGSIEAFYPETHTEAVVGLEALLEAAKQAAISAIAPVTLWEGAAAGPGSTRYNLSRSIEGFKYIRVTVSGGGISGRVLTFINQSSITLSATNLADTGTSKSFWVYEAGLDFTSKTYFTIVRDISIKQSDAVTTPTAGTSEFTILKIEGSNYL